MKYLFFLSFLVIGLAGCFPEIRRTQISEKTFAVGDYLVEEVIYEEDSFPDPRYERVYRVRNGRQQSTLGSYANESQSGIIVSPDWVDGRLVVYSSSHLFLWQPDSEPLHFSPFDAVGWVAFSEQFGTFGLNGHYDIRARKFWVEGDVWLIEYECVRCQAGEPTSILFTSDDFGETFVVEK